MSLGFRNGMPKDLIRRLAVENVHVAPRVGRMRISPHTFESHRAEAMRKLGAKNTADLVRKALMLQPA